VASSASTLDAAESTGPGRTVKFHDGTVVPVLGQGSEVGLGRRPAAVEEEALCTGVSLGMALIDTVESYGDGRSEQFD
jgi:aryl-alcohol dehydrogenase-like predicted oxidoreductase